MGSLLLIIVLSGVILWPREQWWFRFRPSDLHATYIEGPRPLNADMMKRDLALHLETAMRRNARAVDRFGSLLGVAIVLLLVDAGAVVFVVWGS
jgi:hypothetical protein